MTHHQGFPPGRPVGRPASRFRLALALALGLGIALTTPVSLTPALAAGGGGGGGDSHGGASGAGDRPDKETVLPRTEADEVTGTYVQLHVMWLPVLQGRRSRYEAFTIRLVPHPDHRVLACFKAPWAHEAVLMALTEQPVTVEDMTHLETAALKTRLLARIDSQVGPDLFTDVHIGSGIVTVDPESQRLSEMCR